jgi:hypothetical protein
MRQKLATAVLFVAASFALYYGSGMLLLVPGDPFHREPYLDRNRVIYGLFPFLLSLALSIAVGFLWARTRSWSRAKKAIGVAFSCSVGAVLLFWIGLIILADIRNPQGF